MIEPSTTLPGRVADPSTNARPAIGALIACMERLPRRHRVEIARLGKRAKAAKAPRIRRLASAAAAEARRLASPV